LTEVTPLTVSFTVTEYVPGVLADAGVETATAVPDDITKASSKATALLLESLADCINRIVPPETRIIPIEPITPGD